MNKAENSETDLRKKKKKSENPVIALLMTPTYWPVALFEFVVAWSFTRRWLGMLAIAPLIAGMIFFAVAAIKGRKLSSIDIARRYLDLSKLAESDGDDKALSVCYGRLISTPLENENRYQIALFLLQKNRLEEAREQFAMLAPDNKEGYPLAHLAIVRELLSSKEVQNPQILKRLKHHLNVAIKGLPDDPDTLWFAAQYALIENDLPKAAQYLEDAAKKRPEFFLVLAKLYDKLENKEQLAFSIRQADSYFTESLSKNSKDTQARLGLCQCKMWTLQVEAAIQLAEEGLRFQPDSVEMKDLVIAAHLMSFDVLMAQKKIALALSSLQRVLGLDASNIPALEKIANLVSKSPETDWKELRETLENALASGIAMPTVHFVIADGYLQRDEREKAQLHLEIALQQNPNLLTVLNNLAWIEANKEPPNLDRAMQLVEQAVILNPNHPEVLETKGDILVKSGKWTEAIKCIEPLLRVFPDRAELRRKMGESYEKIGDTSLGEKFRKEAEQIEIRLNKEIDKKPKGK